MKKNLQTNHELCQERMKSLENQIISHRADIVRLSQRNDALQTALVQMTMLARELQKNDRKFQDSNRLREGLFLAD